MENTQIKIYNDTIKQQDDFIFIQPVCDFFGIDLKYQLKSINKNPNLKTSASKKTSMLLFGDERERLGFHKQGFITWILQLNFQIVHPTLQEKFLLFQKNILDFMYNNVRAKEETAVAYKRLHKLRSLYGKIGAEIQKENRVIKEFVQEQLDPQLSMFDKQKQLQQSPN